MKKIELLAPAGSIESVYAAVRCGADAVYAGGEKYSARANAVNFTRSELAEAIEYCHLHGVKFYQALNTLLFDDEIKEFLKSAEKSAFLGVDAFIVQDMGAARLIKKAIPEMKLNASTQMTIHTKEGAELAKELGFSRVVLSRELSIAQIEDICKVDIETEVFVHGALCMSVSGQCYISAAIGSRSANRGMCAQACRLPFSAVRNETRFDLSLKDLSAVKHIKKLAQIGVSSVKIEGRMKRAEYVASAVSACRAEIDGFEPDMDTLKAVFSRSGFTDGYLTGNTGKEMFGIRNKEDVVSAEKVLPLLREQFRKETKSLAADFHMTLKKDTNTELVMTCGDICVTVTGDAPQTAEKRPTDLEMLEKQLSKLGDTIYSVGKITAEIGEILIIPASQINAMRREAVFLMDENEKKAKTPVYSCFDIDDVIKDSRQTNEYPSHDKKLLRLELFRSEQLSKNMLEDDEIENIILPINECLKIPFSKKIIAALPRFTDNENALKNQLSELKSKGFSDVLCTNMAHVKIGSDMGFSLHGGFGLNITNSHSAAAYEEMGLEDITLSFECRASQISSIKCNIKTGAVVYGRLPLMLTKNCPIKVSDGCAKCSGSLFDRTEREFKVKCNDKNYFEILNSDLLVMSDRLNEVFTDFVILDFYDESIKQIESVINQYKNRLGPNTKSFTRGLYYRGVNI